MLWRNLEKLGVPSIGSALKIGDTAADMQEAVNAGCLCAGVLEGSSMVGLSEKEFAGLSAGEAEKILADATDKYKEAGADFVIEDITVLPHLIEALSRGEEHEYRV
jgi:phosphonoacetaldehyde hydrolase